MNENKKIETKIMTGNETFIYNHIDTHIRLIDFWKWSISDLVSNATRGRLAEFIVANALKINMNIARNEWQAFDLITEKGIKIEVKSAAYIQSWYQRELSKICFSIKKTKYWDSDSNLQSNNSTRQADVYIFCLLNHQDKDTVNPLNLNQWIFYILNTKEINSYKRSEHSITLKSLEKLTSAVKFGDIELEINRRMSS